MSPTHRLVGMCSDACKQRSNCVMHIFLHRPPTALAACSGVLLLSASAVAASTASTCLPQLKGSCFSDGEPPRAALTAATCQHTQKRRWVCRQMGSRHQLWRNHTAVWRTACKLPSAAASGCHNCRPHHSASTHLLNKPHLLNAAV
jgi:hypothetical protein